MRFDDARQHANDFGFDAHLNEVAHEEPLAGSTWRPGEIELAE